MKDKLRAILSHARMPYICALVAIGLFLPVLGTGLIMDDHAHKMLVLEGSYPGGPRGTWDLFRFLDDDPKALREVVDRGLWPWWSASGFRLAFFRPLASLLHTLDYRLWPNAHAWMHFESILIFAAAAMLATFFYRRLLGPTVAAGLAGLMFAADDAHSMVIAWIANRHSILATAFGIAALLAHDKARKDGWKPGLLLGPGAFALALLSGENGVSVLAYLFAYAVFLDEAHWRKRVSSLGLFGIVAAIWAIGYKLGGYGAAGGAFYIDPIRQVNDYLQAVVIRLPVLLAGQIAAPPADIWMSVPAEKTSNLLGVCLFILAFVGAGLTIVLRKNRTAGFFALGMTLSLFPPCATWPGDRNLLFAGLGGFGLVAQLLTESRAHLGKPGRILASSVSGTFIFLHLVVAPLFLPLRSWATSSILSAYTERAIQSMPSDDALRHKTLIVVSAPDSVVANTIIAAKLNAKAAVPDTLRVLSTAVSGAMHIHRRDDHTLSIRLSAGHMHEPTATVFRDPKRFPFRVGDRIEASGMEAEIKTLTANGSLPERIDFHFAKKLEDASYTWVYWDKRQFVLLDLPKVGEERELPVVPYTEAIGK
jgi:hypothetical protein